MPPKKYRPHTVVYLAQSTPCQSHLTVVFNRKVSSHNISNHSTIEISFSLFVLWDKVSFIVKTWHNSQVNVGGCGSDCQLFRRHHGNRSCTPT